MRKIVLTFGLISGVVMSALMLTSIAFHDRIGFDKGLVVGYTSMVLAFLLIFFGVRSYRDNVAEGRVTFGQAFKVGILIMLVASVVYVVSWEIAYSQFFPDYMAKYAEHVLEKSRAAGASEAQIAAKQAQMSKWAEMYENPLVRAGMTMLEPLPVGIVFTLLSSWLVSRRKTAVAA